MFVTDGNQKGQTKSFLGTNIMCVVLFEIERKSITPAAAADYLTF